MAANTGTISMQIVVDDKGTAVVRRATDRMNRAFNKVGSVLKRVGRSVMSLKAAFVGLAVYGMARVISSWKELADTQEKAEAGMKAAMMSMGRYTKDFHGEILATAAALQKMSTFGDEAILMGAKFLMTYEGISERIMPRVMAAMTDVAALMGGNFVQAANMLGKASMGMTGELRRMGITVDKSVFKLQGFEGILAAIERQVGGQAKALRETDYGGWAAFINVVGDVKEKFGAMASKVLKNVSEWLIPKVEELNDRLAAYIGSGKMAEDAKSWASAISGAIKKIGEALDFVIKKIEAVWKYTKLAGSIVGAGLPVVQGVKAASAVSDAMQKKEAGEKTTGWTSGDVGSIIDAMNRGVTINNTFVEKLNRSDVNNIISEQSRNSFRGGSQWEFGTGGEY